MQYYLYRGSVDIDTLFAVVTNKVLTFGDVSGIFFPAGEAVTVDIPILQTRGLSNRPQDGLLTLLRRAALFESTRIRESHTHAKQKAPA